MTYDVYGCANGQPVFRRDEFLFSHRGRGPIDDDAELVACAEQVTHGWHHAGWRRSFESHYLSDYALSEPFYRLTTAEFLRLKALQRKARQAAIAADDSREWKQKETIHWADNRVEEVFEDQDGRTKSVMVVSPHGDAC